MKDTHRVHILEANCESDRLKNLKKRGKRERTRESRKTGLPWEGKTRKNGFTETA